MEGFFQVTDLKQIIEYRSKFETVTTEKIAITDAWGRILAEPVAAAHDLPGFSRSTMDGYCVRATDTFGATESNPAYMTIIGSIAMGQSPTLELASGEAARIATGGMLPPTADSVVMIEHTEKIDATTLEIYRSSAPGQHVVLPNEDFSKGDGLLEVGQRIRPQETGLLAAFGISAIDVYKRPVVGIISTGDEIVAVKDTPAPGQIRDVNSYTLSSMVSECGGRPKIYGVFEDNFELLLDTSRKAIEQCDMVLISGGSSVGKRDFTIQVLENLSDAHILAHGISISPGKPTILAKVGEKAFWGLPGHVVSAMVVFRAIVRPYFERISGLKASGTASSRPIPALLARNLSSAQGRVDFVRVKLAERDGRLWAEPILGKSGLINTIVKADGLIEIDLNSEGLDQGSEVAVQLL